MIRTILNISKLSFFLSLGKIIYALVNLWLASQLTPKEYAFLGISLAFQTLFASLCGSGLAERSYAELKGIASSLERLQIYSSLSQQFILNVFVFGFALFALYCFGIFSEISPILAIVSSLNGVLMGLISLTATFSQYEFRTNEVIRYSLLGSGAACFSYIMGGLFFPETQYIITLTLFSLFLLGFPFGLYSNMRYNPFRFEGISFNSFRPYLPYFIIAIFGWLCGYGINLVLPSVVSIDDIATYTYLYTFAGFSGFLLATLNSHCMPRVLRWLSSASSNSSALPRIEKLYSLLCLVGIAFSALPLLACYVDYTFITGIPLRLQLSHGDSFNLSWLLLAYVFDIPRWNCLNFFYFHDCSRDLMRITIVSGSLGILIWILMIKLMGSSAIYIGFFAQSFLKTFFFSIYSRIRWNLGQPYGALFLSLLLPILAYFLQV